MNTVHTLKKKKSTILNRRGKEIGFVSFELEVREVETMRKIKPKSVEEHTAEYGKSSKNVNKLKKTNKAIFKHRNHIKTTHEKRKFRGEEKKVQVVETKVGEIVVPAVYTKSGELIRKSFIKPEIEVSRIYHRYN